MIGPPPGGSITAGSPLVDADADALDGVVLVAADVPPGLERLRVARLVGRACAEDVVAGRRVPVERPAAPGIRVVELADDLGIGPGATAVDAHLDAADRCPARPGASLEQV